MEKERRLSLGYEDTDKSIEIEVYGLNFKIGKLDKEELERIDSNDRNGLEKGIDKILGEGASEKINKKRIEDGYGKMDVTVASNILGFIMETYVKETAGSIIDRTVNAVKDVNDDMSNLMNREQRRNYRYRNQYRNNRRNYRRY